MSDNGEDLLSEIMANSPDTPLNPSPQLARKWFGAPATATSEAEKKAPEPGAPVQWTMGGGAYFPVAATTKRVEAGVYSPLHNGAMVGLLRVPINSDGIYTLNDMATERVVAEVETFWEREDRYRKHNLLHKRGILLWGPPGSGKTITIKLLMNEIIKRDGIVILASNVGLTAAILKPFRDIEPTRNIILVFEDIDEIINHNGEAQVLSLLDGEHNVNRVLNLASTNYPGRLGARIINRPSRFDTRVHIGMPTPAARESYLTQSTAGELGVDQLARWVRDTDQMSIAHLRELVAAVYCLGQPYDTVVERLKKMGTPIKANEDGFRKGTLGFTTEQVAQDIAEAWDLG